MTQNSWVDVEKAKADAYEDALRCVEKLASDYTHEHGSYDPSTNAWELHHRHMEKIEAWDDAVEIIRKRKAEKCQVTHACRPVDREMAEREAARIIFENARCSRCGAKLDGSDECRIADCPHVASQR